MAVYSLMSKWLLWVFCNLMCRVTYLKFNIGCNGVKNCRLGTELLGNISRFLFFFFCTWISGKVRLETSASIAHFLGVSLNLLTLRFQNSCWWLYCVLKTISTIRTVFCFILVLRNVTPRPDSSPISCSFQSWHGKHQTTLASLLAHSPEMTM